MYVNVYCMYVYTYIYSSMPRHYHDIKTEQVLFLRKPLLCSSVKGHQSKYMLMTGQSME